MEVIIVGDSSKMVENFTRVMFDIVLQDFKDNNLDFYKKESSKNKEAALKDRKLLDIKEDKQK